MLELGFYTYHTHGHPILNPNPNEIIVMLEFRFFTMHALTNTFFNFDQDHMSCLLSSFKTQLIDYMFVYMDNVI